MYRVTCTVHDVHVISLKVYDTTYGHIPLSLKMGKLVNLCFFVYNTDLYIKGCTWLYTCGAGALVVCGWQASESVSVSLYSTRMLRWVPVSVTVSVFNTKMMQQVAVSFLCCGSSTECSCNFVRVASSVLQGVPVQDNSSGTQLNITKKK